MNKRLFLLLLVVGLVFGAWLWWRQTPTPKPVAMSEVASATPVPGRPTPQPSAPPSQLPATPQPEPVTTGESTSAPWPRMPYQGLADPRWAEMNRRDAVDKHWQWKMPINFY